jgi:CBS domain containing-hemolysin-like protein
VKEAVDQQEIIRFSRVPVYGDSPDDFTGVVRRQQLYESLSAGQGERAVHEIAAAVHAVPETSTVRQALDEFVRQRQHLFVVVDEFGGMAGIITLEDAIETLLGVEIVDETDAVADMRQLAVRMFRRLDSRKP